jgi:hypothetical protein
VAPIPTTASAARVTLMISSPRFLSKAESSVARGGCPGAVAPSCSATVNRRARSINDPPRLHLKHPDGLVASATSVAPKRPTHRLRFSNRRRPLSSPGQKSVIGFSRQPAIYTDTHHHGALALWQFKLATFSISQPQRQNGRDHAALTKYFFALFAPWRLCAQFLVSIVPRPHHARNQTET